MKNVKVIIDKEDFIEILASLTPEEINDLIKSKGKDPKLVPLCTFYNTIDEDD